MRAIVQRVSAASVTVGGEIVGRIGRGLLVYVGVAKDDGPADVEYVAGKVAHIRVFEDGAGKMNLDVAAVGGGFLVISNFTLHADTRAGRRPAFTEAAPADAARERYEAFCTRLRDLGHKVETGRFRELMHITSENDGPINIIIDSRDSKGGTRPKMAD